MDVAPIIPSIPKRVDDEFGVNVMHFFAVAIRNDLSHDVVESIDDRGGTPISAGLARGQFIAAGCHGISDDGAMSGPEVHLHIQWTVAENSRYPRHLLFVLGKGPRMRHSCPAGGPLSERNQKFRAIQLTMVVLKEI